MKSLLGIGECMMELSSMGDQLWKQGFAGDVLARPALYCLGGF